jgi:hypothetical protein
MFHAHEINKHRAVAPVLDFLKMVEKRSALNTKPKAAASRISPKRRREHCLFF